MVCWYFERKWDQSIKCNLPTFLDTVLDLLYRYSRIFHFMYLQTFLFVLSQTSAIYRRSRRLNHPVLGFNCVRLQYESCPSISVFSSITLSWHDPVISSFTCSQTCVANSPDSPIKHQKHLVVKKVQSNNRLETWDSSEVRNEVSLPRYPRYPRQFGYTPQTSGRAKISEGWWRSCGCLNIVIILLV
jgi:hypothetical protein